MQNVNTESSPDSTSQSKVESNIKEPHNAMAAESKLANSPVAISPIANLPIALFASVMGIGGLSLVLKKASVVFGSVALANTSFNNGANAVESTLDSTSSWQGAVAPFLWWGGVWLCGVGSGYFRPFACVLLCKNILSL